ncbi:RTA1 domain-containing protein [Aspergillus affinis]|uniref:RTA1 domain-containing protein n=1 Tax=Aspergillus affinis TaxID=1070780 RepID=UPI0022FF2FBC|nr:RTA1 like protein [Aspergillus affinis]KAI9039832.1 RTA1 like protein [Aspergillus affinis]
MSSQTCTSVTPSCPVTATTYGYYPNLGGNIFFTIIFALCGLTQIYFSLRFKSWTFAIALLIGTFLEMAGYIGRILMHSNPWDAGAFKLQIVALVLAPSFIAAGIYLTLKHIILNLGSSHSKLKPRLFTWIFIGCDVGSLFLQAAGGGVAASAEDDLDMTSTGNNIIIAGIVFQVVTMAVCGVLAVDFFARVFRRGGGFSAAAAASGGEKMVRLDEMRGGETGVEGTDGNGVPVQEDVAAGAGEGVTAKQLKIVVVVEIVAIPEMAGGWGNPLMQREDEFLVLDGMMIAIACITLTAFHPGLYLPSLRKGASKKA